MFAKRKRAFTLLELMTVIVIITILFTVLIGKVNFATDRTKVAGVQTDFRSFQLGLESCASVHFGFDDLYHQDESGKELVRELNAFLDNRLHLTLAPPDNSEHLLDADIVAYTDHAYDPWKNAYILYYYCGDAATANGEDGGNLGCVNVVCIGPDLYESTVWDATALDAHNGMVQPDAEAMSDDMTLTVLYTFKTGMPTAASITKGFPTNQDADIFE